MPMLSAFSNMAPRISVWNQAEAYVASFDESFALLFEHPRIGAVHPDVRPPIHSWRHGSHRIFYDIEDDMIIVRRILHKSMDVAAVAGVSLRLLDETT